MTGLTFLQRISALCFLFSLAACLVIKNPPQNKPFIYQTNVHVQSELTDEVRKELELGLTNQLHDSVKVKSVAKLIGWDKGPKLFYDVWTRPTVFDSLNAEKTIGFMQAYLNSQGYFRDSVRYRVKIDTAKGGKQLRTYLDFYAYPGVPTRLDSIAYRLNADTATATARQQRAFDTIQQITLNNLGTSVIKKGDPFSKYSLSAERDRLANVFRNNGYLRFSEEEMLVLWDTVGIELLRPTLDPIEQAQLLQRQAERRAHPVADVEYRLRENPDSTRITRYYVGHVTVYPEYTADTTRNYRFSDTVGQYVIRQNGPLYKKKIFPDYILLNPGDLYRQTNVLETQGKFNGLNAWRTVNIVPVPRLGQDTADFEIRLTPARKYGFNASVEGSYNSRSNISLAQGNLIGFALNTGVQNRNFAHAANQSGLTLRGSVELNASIQNLVQTLQANAGYNLQIPRLVPRFVRQFSRHKENNNVSFLSLNGGLTNRLDYFNLKSLNASWGYQFGWRNKQLTVRFPNLEYNYLIRKDSLLALIDTNKSYRYIFNTGVIVSALGNYSVAHNRGNVTQLLTLTGEFSGLPGQLRNAFATNLYRFAKLDFEVRWNKKSFRNAFALRGFAGAGWPIRFSSLDSVNSFLPFFRQYVVGGPNSMRAWRIRRLGPGSSIRSFGTTEAPDRFGDIRLEANGEYRIFLTDYHGVGINTVLFVDMGNVWFMRENRDFPGGEFPRTFSKFWKDIAIGTGTGLRVDFGFFKFRLDYAYKVKDPTPDVKDASAQNKWFSDWQLLNGQLQLGIDYPF